MYMCACMCACMCASICVNGRVSVQACVCVCMDVRVRECVPKRRKAQINTHLFHRFSHPIQYMRIVRHPRIFGERNRRHPAVIFERLDSERNRQSVILRPSRRVESVKIEYARNYYLVLKSDKEDDDKSLPRCFSLCCASRFVVESVSLSWEFLSDNAHV